MRAAPLHPEMPAVSELSEDSAHAGIAVPGPAGVVDPGPAGKGNQNQLSLVSPATSELFCTPLQVKSLPCHSYKLLGGRGGTPRVHISLILKHLASSGIQPSNSLPAFTYKNRASKPIRAITYENTGGRGSASSHFLFSIFASNPSLHPSAKLLPRPRRERREFPACNRRADLPHQLQIKVKIVVRVQDRAQDFVGHE